MPKSPILLALILSAFWPAAWSADDYQLGPESMRQAGVPQGMITTNIWRSKIFDGTIREYYLYVPHQYRQEKPAAVMVFQDGHAYLNPEGQIRATIVLDNLIHKGDLPVILGIFINPGHKGEELPSDRWKGSNRSFEYDTLSDQYARFLLEEILPEVAARYSLRPDAAGRAIAGMSSGGICAWTVAWERPQEFGKVLSHIGSFTNIRGGHNYPAYIRKTEKKPIRVFLQAGSGDLDNAHGHWPLANQQMAAALKFKGYDYRFEYGDGAHNGKHGGAIFPDSLRWLWRETP